MNSLIEYETATGRIIATHVSSSHLEIIEVPGVSVVAGTGCMETEYVKDGVVLARPEMSAALFGATITGVPESATVRVEDVEYIADGTPITFLFDFPGSYLITVKLWPYLDWSTVIDY